MGHLNEVSGRQNTAAGLGGRDDDAAAAGFEIPDIIRRAAATPRKFYFDLKTGQVTEGPSGSWRNRLGPYPTREAAANALKHAQDRDAKWEQDTKDYRDNS